VCLATATGWLFKLPPAGWIGLSFLVLAGVLALDGALKRRHKKLCLSLAGVGLSLVVAICLFPPYAPPDRVRGSPAPVSAFDDRRRAYGIPAPVIPDW
jgi:hypothetical protein